ncbi:unnamed protein product [Cuscuta epithymum]|uniref:Uncharacterized protein n=1 Tax=Cuscuta epithymum TaxID=186058 RepID=A0AAV0DFD7_9ASTE|nr:unnamed protein product [Cuscuta epithymum]
MTVTGNSLPLHQRRRLFSVLGTATPTMAKALSLFGSSVRRSLGKVSGELAVLGQQEMLGLILGPRLLQPQILLSTMILGHNFSNTPIFSPTEAKCFFSNFYVNCQILKLIQKKKNNYKNYEMEYFNNIASNFNLKGRVIR